MTNLGITLNNEVEEINLEKFSFKTAKVNKNKLYF